MIDELRHNSRPEVVQDGRVVEDDRVLSISSLLRILWKRLWIVVLITVVLVGATVGFSLWQTPRYEASVLILVGQEQRSEGSSSLQSDVEGLKQLSDTVKEAVDTRPVAEAVIQQLGLSESPRIFLRNLRAQEVPGTQFIRVYYQDASPERAQEIANAVAFEFSDQVSAVSPNANAITATVWEPAAIPISPASPDPLRNGLVALVVGLMLGMGLAFLIDHLDDSWRSTEEVERISGVPTFGVIPAFETFKGRRRKA